MYRLYVVIIFWTLSISLATAAERCTHASLFMREPIAHFSEKTFRSFEFHASSVTIEKSKGKAFLLSFLVPGLGQRYLGSNGAYHFFLGAEIALWLSYTGFKSYYNMRVNDYKTFAASHAGVDLNGKSNSYFIDVGNYDSIYDFNAAKLRQRNLPKYYRDTETYYWQWDTDASRKKFDQLRVSADRADNRATFALGAILANHMVSAIHAAWKARKINTASESTIDWDMKFAFDPMQPILQVQLSKQF